MILMMILDFDITKTAKVKMDNLQKLRPMSEAPIDVEILAWHKHGKNFHQVKWKDRSKSFGMRWNAEYSQKIYAYEGWLPMPESAI